MGSSLVLELLLERETGLWLRWSIMFRTTSASIGMTQLTHYPYIKFRFSNYLCIILCFFKFKILFKHRHGIRQLQSGWADGPSYITQCPIQTNQSYVYNFTITGQRGTLFWHAHISWLRATVYGPLIILPKHNASYPFPKPHKEVPIIFGN